MLRSLEKPSQLLTNFRRRAGNRDESDFRSDPVGIDTQDLIHSKECLGFNPRNDCTASRLTVDTTHDATVEDEEFEEFLSAKKFVCAANSTNSTSHVIQAIPT